MSHGACCVNPPEFAVHASPSRRAGSVSAHGTDASGLRERRQGQYAQMNDTWGVLAPVAQLNDELPPGAMRFTKVRQRELEAA